MFSFPKPPIDRWVWLASALRAIYDNDNANMETIMATFQDLRAATEQLLAQNHLLANGLQTLTLSVERLRTDFDRIAAAGILTADQQAMLDASVASVTSAAADLAQQTQSLATEQTAVDTSDPAQPAPAPPNPVPTPEPAALAPEQGQDLRRYP